MWLVNAVLGRVDGILVIRVCDKSFRVDDLIRKPTSYDCHNKASISTAGTLARQPNRSFTERILQRMSQIGHIPQVFILTPTTSHWPSEPNKDKSLPRSCTSPATLVAKRVKMLYQPDKNSTNLHPLGFPVPPDRFRSLKQMLHLRDTRLRGKRNTISAPITPVNIGIANIRIRFVNKCVEHLHCLPDPHSGTLLGFEFYPRFDVEFNGLLLW